MVILFALLGFFVGYIQQDFRTTFHFLAVGGGISAVVRAAAAPSDAVLFPPLTNTCLGSLPGTQICLPDWPWWNRHPLKWLEAPEDEELEKEEKKKVKKVKTAKANKAK